MSENQQSFEEMLEDSLKNFGRDKRIKGIVERITPNEVYVDIGRKQTGLIPIWELSEKKDVDPNTIVKVGDEIEVLILKSDDQEGFVKLSKKRADRSQNFSKICEAFKNKTILKGKVSSAIKGGIIVLSKGTKIFIPASLAASSKKDNLDDLVSKEVSFRIIEIDEQKKRAIGSIKNVVDEKRREAKNKFWEAVEIGKEYEGTVKTIKDFGVFVDIGGIDGMVHVSELSWERIRNPSDLVKVGDKLKVTIKDLDEESKKISLTCKKIEDSPWEIMRKNVKVGDIVETEIVGFTDFGAFANITKGVDGLIHISQISDKRINSAQDVLKMGQKVKVMVQDIDLEKKRVSLSITATKESRI